MFGTTAGAGEEGILAIRGQRADGALDSVGVELDTAVTGQPRATGKGEY
jgi:hypothetical protein